MHTMVFCLLDDNGRGCLARSTMTRGGAAFIGMNHIHDALLKRKPEFIDALVKDGLRCLNFALTGVPNILAGGRP